MNIGYIGSFGDHSGYGEANRNIIYALHQAGVTLATERMQHSQQQAHFGKAYQVAQEAEHKAIKTKIRIVHLTPNLYLQYLKPTEYHIGHLFWETDKLPQNWVWYCNKMDEIWTGCERQKETLLNSGVKVPIFVFPQPIITEKLDIYKPYKLPFFKGFLFYSIFEWIERKNPVALLKAYYEEFSRSEPVGLLIKTYRNTFTEDKKAYVRKAIRDLKPDGATAARVYLFEDIMNEAEIYRLHATGNCFVSTHRGEGWGRPQMEAMVMGKPIISTQCGGIHEYLNENVAYLLPWKKTPVTLDEGNISYEEGQNWADVDIDALRKTMRRVFENQKEAMMLGQKGKDFIVDNFTPLKVGTMMKERLIEIENTL